MRVLWLCSFVLPEIAEKLRMEASNKEGWVAGLAQQMASHAKEENIDFAVASPVPRELLPAGEKVLERTFEAYGGTVTFYGFYEDMINSHVYDAGLEEVSKEILRRFQPQIVHCFGTEFPHTLAMCRVFPQKDRLLIGIQGVCARIAAVYEAGLPEYVVKRKTFRDVLKRDGIIDQKEKFVLRGQHEIEALKLAGNVAGRTAFDKSFAEECHEGIRYFKLGETLRSDFYETTWDKEQTEPHSIFVSQGDYPLKGLHFVLLALPQILKRFPDAKVYVAGNVITARRSLKDKLKLPSYGKYLLELIQKGNLGGHIQFLGRLTASQMKAQYLKRSLFLNPSAIENSPNSLGEAMLLGMPCVAANVGGVPSVFTGGEDGITYEGDPYAGSATTQEMLERISKALADAVITMWEHPEKEALYCQYAKVHAEKNHDRRGNYAQAMEIYRAIDANKNEG